MYERYLKFPSLVKGDSIEPHWMVDGSCFWYAEGFPVNTVIYKVDPRSNTKTPLFDTARLRQALKPLLRHEPPYKGLPFDKFTFVDQDEQAVKFTVEDKEFILRHDTYKISRVPAVSEEDKSRLVPQVVQKPYWSADEGEMMEILSPDRRWFALDRNHNLWLRSTHDGRIVQLTTDGIKDYEWDVSRTLWSPDSFKLAVFKYDYRELPKIPIVHYLKPREEVEWLYDFNRKAGERFEQNELFIVDILSKRQIHVDTGKEPDQWIFTLEWLPDGSELLFARADRTLKKLDLMAANARTGITRVVLTETEKTTIQHIVETSALFTLFEDAKRFIWISERHGWRHLYLYDLDGRIIQRLTEGDFPVVEVVAVDERAGWVYFTAHGDKQRPYDTHIYRVNLEGKGFTRLTEGIGQHDIQFAPSKEFFLDTHSSVARSPVVELRRANGTLLQTLTKANLDDLKELKWSPPEEFVVKAADGETDLYGVLYKPYDFDPKKKYPVIEVIYGGPRVSVVPKTFTSHRAYFGQAPALAQLGFITFIVDARGTPERGKAFQDVAYGNLGRHEIPDHVAALKQVAEQRPYMDLSRVGIVGHSLGGYFALRALLLAPDVYHVGVASAPVVDTPIFFWEIYMGLPQDNREGYDHYSNLRLAGNLKGKLLLIHGTSDSIARISETMKMADALIRADKSFDLLVMPGQGHSLWRLGGSAPYWRQAIRRYFQENLTPED